LSSDLAGGVEGRFDTVASNAISDLKKFVRNDKERCLALGLAGGKRQFLLRTDQMAHLIVRKSKRGDELGFGQFLGLAFDHYHVILRSHIDQIEIAHHTLAVNRIHHELSIDPADSNRGDRARERNVGNAQRCACTVDEENVGIVFAVGAQEYANNLCVVEVALGEQRTKRAIRHAAGQSLLLGGTTLALEISAREFADSGRLLAVIDGERKEILAFLHGGRGYRGHQNNCVAGADGYGTVGESRELACFNADGGLADGGRDGMRHDT
jgi:hypothetical protein